MRDYRDAKPMAQTLREALKAKSITISHTEALELVAQTLGFRNWHVLSATIQADDPSPTKSEGPNGARTPSTSHCSFCGKPQHEVSKLIAGPGVFICDECIDLCDDILLGEGPGLEENALYALASKTTEELIRLKAKANTSLGHGHAVMELIGAAARLGSEPAAPSERRRPNPQWGFILRKTPDERLAYAREIEHRMGYLEGVIRAATGALAERGVHPPEPST